MSSFIYREGISSMGVAIHSVLPSFVHRSVLTWWWRWCNAATNCSGQCSIYGNTVCFWSPCCITMFLPRMDKSNTSFTLGRGGWDASSPLGATKSYTLSPNLLHKILFTFGLCFFLVKSCTVLPLWASKEKGKWLFEWIATQLIAKASGPPKPNPHTPCVSAGLWFDYYKCIWWLSIIFHQFSRWVLHYLVYLSLREAKI